MIELIETIFPYWLTVYLTLNVILIGLGLPIAKKRRNWKTPIEILALLCFGCIILAVVICGRFYLSRKKEE
jgi:hypothetical protein